MEEYYLSGTRQIPFWKKALEYVFLTQYIHSSMHIIWYCQALILLILHNEKSVTQRSLLTAVPNTFSCFSSSGWDDTEFLYLILKCFAL